MEAAAEILEDMVTNIQKLDISVEQVRFPFLIALDHSKKRFPGSSTLKLGGVSSKSLMRIPPL